MLKAARIDSRPDMIWPVISLIPTTSRREEKCPTHRFFGVTGANQTFYNLYGTDALGPKSSFITGANLDTYCSCNVFGDALGNLLNIVSPGTGGELNLAEPTMQNLISASGAYVVIQTSLRPEIRTIRADEKLTGVGKELALVRHYFSLTTTDLSRVLLVERPTVYAWLDGKSEPKRENRARIRKLFNIASKWREKSSLSIGKFLYEPIDGELSLIDFLLRDTLETEAINRILARVLEALNIRARAKLDRSVAAIVNRSGFKPLSKELECERFDQITRF
jgi:DNA-binding transcriptional regulator YiaG